MIGCVISTLIGVAVAFAMANYWISKDIARLRDENERLRAVIADLKVKVAWNKVGR